MWRRSKRGGERQVPEVAPPMRESHISVDSHEDMVDPEIQELVKSVELIMAKADSERSTFLQQALDRGLSGEEIAIAARDAFNAGKLPRVILGEVGRGTGYTAGVFFGEEASEEQVKVVILNDYETGVPKTLYFELNEDDDTRAVPLEPDPSDPDGWYVYLANMPQKYSPRGSVEEWRHTLAMFEKVELSD